MTTLSALWIAITVLAVLFGVSVFYNFKFALALLSVQDAIQESIGLIEQKHHDISEVLKVPIFYDSPQIKQVVEDLKASRDAILYVAEQFADIDGSIKDTSQDENTSQDIVE
jgi:hypothetical protein